MTTTRDRVISLPDLQVMVMSNVDRISSLTILQKEMADKMDRHLRIMEKFSDGLEDLKETVERLSWDAVAKRKRVENREYLKVV